MYVIVVSHVTKGAIGPVIGPFETRDAAEAYAYEIGLHEDVDEWPYVVKVVLAPLP